MKNFLLVAICILGVLIVFKRLDCSIKKISPGEKLNKQVLALLRENKIQAKTVITTRKSRYQYDGTAICMTGAYTVKIKLDVTFDGVAVECKEKKDKNWHAYIMRQPEYMKYFEESEGIEAWKELGVDVKNIEFVDIDVYNRKVNYTIRAGGFEKVFTMFTISCTDNGIEINEVAGCQKNLYAGIIRQAGYIKNFEEKFADMWKRAGVDIKKVEFVDIDTYNRKVDYTIKTGRFEKVFTMFTISCTDNGIEINETADFSKILYACFMRLPEFRKHWKEKFSGKVPDKWKKLGIAIKKAEFVDIDFYNCKLELTISYGAFEKVFTAFTCFCTDNDIETKKNDKLLQEVDDFVKQCLNP